MPCCTTQAKTKLALKVLDFKQLGLPVISDQEIVSSWYRGECSHFCFWTQLPKSVLPVTVCC